MYAHHCVPPPLQLLPALSQQPHSVLEPHSAVHSDSEADQTITRFVTILTICDSKWFPFRISKSFIVQYGHMILRLAHVTCTFL